jgi:hypothetical protein
MRRTTPDLVGRRQTVYVTTSRVLLGLTILYVLWTNYVIFVGGNLPLTSIDLGAGSAGAGTVMLAVGDLTAVLVLWFVLDAALLNLLHLVLRHGHGRRRPVPVPVQGQSQGQGQDQDTRSSSPAAGPFAPYPVAGPQQGQQQWDAPPAPPAGGGQQGSTLVSPPGSADQPGSAWPSPPPGSGQDGR